MNFISYFILFSLSISSVWAFETLEMKSPDQLTTLTIHYQNRQLTYEVRKRDTLIVRRSLLGMMIRDRADMRQNLELVTTQPNIKTHNQTWEQVWGQKRFVTDNHKSTSIRVRHDSSKIEMILDFKVFNDGVAFRYSWPNQLPMKHFEIWDEATEFNFSSDDQAWWIPAFQWNRYEFLFQKSQLKDLDTVHTPLTLELKNGYTVAIHEANLINFPSMAIKGLKDGRLKADLVPWSDGIRAKLVTPAKSSWRMLIIADEQKDLIESDMILNLNDPVAIKDTSWIETGKYIGMWWGIHLGKYTFGQGPNHGATTANVQRYIDFAAEHGFKGVLVEGWNYGWDGDWMANGSIFRFDEAVPGFDVEYLSEYAKVRGVRIVGHHETSAATKNYEDQLEQAYDFLNKYNMNVVKTGYVGERHDREQWHHGQYGVRHYTKVMKYAAQRQVMLVVHEPIKHTGLERTYPNLMSSEGARGQEYDAWSSDGGNPPNHTTILPMTRMLAGPMDFTAGTFDLTFDQWRPFNRVNTTLAKQLALFVVIYSPWQMASDLPENYATRPREFEFIKNVPVDWDKTVALDSKIGSHTVIARKDRNSENWYLGAITNEQGRKITIKLDFLDDKKASYKVRAYQDARGTSWLINPHDVEYYETRVKASGTFDLNLAPGGGLALEFIKE